MDEKRFGFLFSLFAILFIGYFLSLNLVSAGLISSSGSIVSDGPLYNVVDEISGGTFCSGEEYCSDYSDSLECESNVCSWNDEPGSVGVASITGDYSYNAQWDFKNEKGNKTGSARINYVLGRINTLYAITCVNGVNCTQTITNEQGSSTSEIAFPLDGYVFNNNSGWFTDLFSSEFECTMGFCNGGAINVQENINTSKAVVKDSYSEIKVTRDFKFSARGEEECGIVNFGSSDVCNYEADVLEKWVPDVHFLEASCYLDPDYVKETFEKRKFKPTEITPFDDIICEARIRVEPHLPQFITKPSLKGELYTLDGNGEWTVLITEGDLKFAWTNSSIKINPFNPFLTEQLIPTYDYDVYQWKIKGWDYDGNTFSEYKDELFGSPVGWKDDKDILEKIIANTNQNQNIFFLVSESKKPENNLSYNLLTSNCLRVFGKDDAISISFLRSVSSSFTLGHLIFTTIHEIINKGFIQASPLRENLDSFSFYSDLYKFDDSTFLRRFDKESWFFDESAAVKIIKESSCSSDYFAYFKEDGMYLGYVYPGSDSIMFFNYDAAYPLFTSTFIHEFGHAFGGLLDEYDVSAYRYNFLERKLISFFSFFREGTKNCRVNPDWGIFGDIYSPCFLLYRGIKPTNNSVMEGFGALPYFNVVSCGYLLQKIKGCSSIQSCWDECMHMGYVIKPENYQLSTEQPGSIREKIASIADDYMFYTAWNSDEIYGVYGKGINKCNIFVADVLNEAGASPGEPNVINPREAFLPWVDEIRGPPFASQWANPDYEIPGWKVLSSGEIPQAGDVVAYKSDTFTESTGHVAIVASSSSSIGTSSSWGSIASTDFGFNLAKSEGKQPTFRRFVGFSN